MNETTNVVRGILHPDGTLELAERPNLPAGDVEVTIRPVPSEAPKETLWESMQRSRAELEASGHRFRTKEEIDADLADDRDWGEARLEEIRGQNETERPTSLAGPNEVTILPVAVEKKPENWFEYLQRTRAELEASGAVFRTKEEIDADIEEMRDWDSRLDEIRLQIEEGRGKEQQ